MAFNLDDSRRTALVDFANLGSIGGFSPRKLALWCRLHRIATTLPEAFTNTGERRWRYQRFFVVQEDGRDNTVVWLLDNGDSTPTDQRDLRYMREELLPQFFPESRDGVLPAHPHRDLYEATLTGTRDLLRVFLDALIAGDDISSLMRGPLKQWFPRVSDPFLWWRKDPKTARFVPTLENRYHATFQSALMSRFIVKAAADPTVVTHLARCPRCGSYGYHKRRRSDARYCSRACQNV